MWPDNSKIQQQIFAQKQEQDDEGQNEPARTENTYCNKWLGSIDSI